MSDYPAPLPTLTTPTLTALSARQLLKVLAAEALRQADGERAVQAALKAEPLSGRIRVLALGKAAAAMWRGAAQALGAQIEAALIIAPEPACVRDHVIGAPIPQWRVGSHPLPDERSLVAGEAALAFVSASRVDETLLVLLSGGASALCEALPDGVTLATMRELQRSLLASNLAIADINAIRQVMSRIKAGGLARCCAADVPIRQLILSDVPDDDVRVIGSAPFIDIRPPRMAASLLPAAWQQWWQRHGERLGTNGDESGLAFTNTAFTRPAANTTVIAGNCSVRNAIQRLAVQQGLSVVCNRTFAGECKEVAALIATSLREGPSGLYLFGGECHLQLPARPGRGGRNQHLALLLAQALHGGRGVALLTLASDGVDGQSDAAGALFVSDDWAQIPDVMTHALTAITTASSYDCWQRFGGLLFTGATGSNIADLVLCWKSPSSY